MRFFCVLVAITAAAWIGVLQMSAIVHMADKRSEQQQLRNWHFGSGTVQGEPQVSGETPETAYAVANVSYRDYYGRPKTARVFLPPQVKKGQPEKLGVSRQGSLWVKDGVGPSAPDNGSGNTPWAGKAPWYDLVPLVILVIAALLGSMVILIIVATVTRQDWKQRPASLPLLAVRRLRQAAWKWLDASKLQWEFWRRRRQLRPTPAYKAVRRFQQSLARKDPIPSVIQARRRANEVLTEVLKRDHEPSLEVVNGTLDHIMKDAQLDRQFRHEATVELAADETA